MNNNEVTVLPVETVSATKCMVFGILAIALCETGVLGIIFGAIALSLTKRYASEHGGVISGQAKVGNILGRIGLILGIVLSVFWVVSIIVIAALIGAVGADYGANIGDIEDLFEEMMALPRFIF